MRKKIIFVISVILVGNLSFAQKIIPSKIKEVTLFTNQALVKREATLKVKKGLNNILLEINAFSIDENSLSAKVFGEGEVWQVQVKKVYLKKFPQKEIEKIKEKLKEKKEERRSLIFKKDILNKKEDFLNSLINFSHTQFPKDLATSQIDVEKTRRVFDFLDEKLKEITKEREVIDKKIAELNKEIDILEKELNSFKSSSQKLKRVIEIVFNSYKEGMIKVEATYLVYNCSWKPFYKINAPLDLKNIELTMFSKIKQKTGENWKDVKLNISNVVPLRSIRLPQLESWILGVRRYMKYSRMDKMMLKESISREPGVGILEEKEAPSLIPSKRELPLSFEYSFPQKLTIESKEKTTTLALFSKKLKGEFFHYAVPKKISWVFLVCKTRFDKELLPGDLSVYFDERFIGKTYLEEKKAGEDFYFNLGVDREIKIKREKIKDEVKETFFGKLKRQTLIRSLAFKIKIENLKDKPVKLKVLDAIPVSQTDRIVIKDVKIYPKPSKENYQDKKGVMLWELNLKPKEKKEIKIEFKITYPKDVALWGI